MKRYSDEELKLRKKESNKKSYLKNREKYLKYFKEYYEKNREKHLDYNKKRYEGKKEIILEENKKYAEIHKDELKKYHTDYSKNYRKTKKGRALYLANGYKQSDIIKNRGECTITPEWIMENIFTQSCYYCGETDWRKLGCDRKDNSLPHTPDNVVCSCWKCNNKKVGNKIWKKIN